ncbi:ADP-forming succinate--CoA ligase subunit beta [Pseudenhygromyxa sp. WMMC2535]|uniref:ADP-forming succinate--CoA ligase subunit beta n=1 Tax=Pseudenhygromyxa sp. WMMC2535 TaxID=2712867 RepID=UPI0015560AC6|nr:ADP-forming succinate--CoA ligase subunit beta [Pseudenhygromyxa sp. WMMC2535]NVB42343.1 ADP-forming succinate--CoA ligase subunit beta [Pseudenhygromyxa sp. WMMC2535]
MKIHEYQAKELLRDAGVPVPLSQVAFSAEEARVAAAKLIDETDSEVVVVKSQIHAGGRGKGRFKEHPELGGVKVVKGAGAAKETAEKMFGSTLVTIQTGPEGKVVNRLLIEQGMDIKQELYLAATLDRDTGRVTIMASTEGGMDIEEVAESHPEKIFRRSVDPAFGLQGFEAREIAYKLGLDGKTARKMASFLVKFYDAYVKYDCSLLEINPLLITGAGDVYALDAKATFDDNALFRHKHIEALRDEDEEDPAELEAKNWDLSYVALDGTIGCMVNGAGLAMATMDIIKYFGAEPANFLDVGGGATEERVTAAFKIISKDPNLKGILVNIFGGIMKCDTIAKGVIGAVKEVGLEVPLVVRLEGTNVDLGKKLLGESGLKITAAGSLREAAQKIVEMTK